MKTKPSLNLNSHFSRTNNRSEKNNFKSPLPIVPKLKQTSLLSFCNSTIEDTSNNNQPAKHVNIDQSKNKKIASNDLENQDSCYDDEEITESDTLYEMTFEHFLNESNDTDIEEEELIEDGTSQDNEEEEEADDINYNEFILNSPTDEQSDIDICWNTLEEYAKRCNCDNIDRLHESYILWIIRSFPELNFPNDINSLSDKDIWLMLSMRPIFKDLASLHDRVVYIPSSESECERIISLLKKVVKPNCTRTSSDLEKAKITYIKLADQEE